MQELYSVQQIAEKTKKSRFTVWRHLKELIFKGEINPLKIADTYFLNVDELVKLAQKIHNTKMGRPYGINSKRNF